MSAWRETLRGIGGPCVVTWWTFWAVLAANALSHFMAIGQGAYPLYARLLAVGLSTIAMFIPLLVLRFTILRHPRHPLPWVAIAGFAVAAVTRTVVLSAVLGAFGPAPGNTFASRLASSFLWLFAVMLLVALLTSAYQLQSRRIEDLLLLRGQLHATQQRIETELASRNEAAVANVRERLLSEWETLASTDDVDMLPALQRLATDVVRPMSHDLARSVPSWVPGVSDVSAHVRPSEVLATLGQRGLFRPWIVGATAAAMTVAPMAYYSPRLVLLMPLLLLLTTGLALSVGNMALNRVLPLSTTPRSLALVIITALLCTVVPGATAWSLVGGAEGVTWGLGMWLGEAALALLIATIRAIFADHRRTLEDLAGDTDRLRVALVRLRQVEWYHQRALSRALHGEMQAVVTTAALRLHDALARGQEAGPLLKEAQESIRLQIDVLDFTSHPPLPLPDILERITGLWGSVCDVCVNVAPEVASLLERDPVLRTAVSEVVTEAISNAVRHGAATSVAIDVDLPTPDVLEAIVGDNGARTGVAGSPGLGTQLLDEITLTWSLAETDEGHHFAARFPVVSSDSGGGSPNRGGSGGDPEGMLLTNRWGE